MHPPEAAVPRREPSLSSREINNSCALVYFLSVLPHGFFPMDARIAEDFSISICIPSPEFIIWFSRYWGPTEQARSTQAWSCFAELESGVCGVTVCLTVLLFLPVLCSPVNMGVGMISVNKKGVKPANFNEWAKDLWQKLRVLRCLRQSAQRCRPLPASHHHLSVVKMTILKYKSEKIILIY